MKSQINVSHATNSDQNFVNTVSETSSTGAAASTAKKEKMPHDNKHTTFNPNIPHSSLDVFSGCWQAAVPYP